MAIASETSETNVSRVSPHDRAAPTLPAAVPIHSSLVLSTLCYMETVPRQQDYEDVVSKINGLIMDQHLPAHETTHLLSDPSHPAPFTMAHVVINEAPVAPV